MGIRLPRRSKEGANVSGLFPRPIFTEFGPHRLAVAEPLAVQEITAPRPSRMRGRLREMCPRQPGVYGMVDAAGELIYVGKAKSLRARLLGYFRPRSRDPKAGRIAAAARRILWEPAPSEFAALLRELELIRRWQPHFNVHGQPRRHRRTFVCLGRQPAPYVFLARNPAATVHDCFGPIFAGTRAREAVRRLNDWFGLRDCPQAQPMIFADQDELFPVARAAGCIRFEIGTCLGPCAAACSRTTYRDRVRAARSFLDGTDRTLLESLRRDMVAASAALDFERAAALRDRLAPLEWLDGHLERLRQARQQHTFIYPVQDTWYLIRRGFVVTAIPAPHDPATRRRAAEMITLVFEKTHCWTGATRAEEIDGVLLVSAWFRRHPEEYERTFNPALIDNYGVEPLL